jgi:peroxiredoxin
MRNGRRLRASVAVILAAVISAASIGATQPADRPAYRLSLGRQVTYVGRSTFDFAGTRLNTASTAVYRVVGRASDGAGWRIVGTVAVTGEPTAVVRFDLWPDGRLELDPAVDDGGASTLFPPLPPSATADHWAGSKAVGDDEDGGPVTYRRTPATRPGTMAFVAEQKSSGVIAGEGSFRSSSSSTDTFDLNLGLLVGRSGTVVKTLANLRTSQTDTVDLAADVTLSADQANAFATQADAYLVANSAYGVAWGDAQQAKDREAAYVRSVDPLLALQRSGRLVDPTLRSALEQSIDAAHSAISAKLGLVGRPAPDWDLPDLADHRHALIQQRGKVVVPDFWFRACPGCVEAMPDVQQLADHYANRPVTFFGMNLDRNAADAQAIVDRCHLTFPTLRLAGGGEAVLKAYQIRGCPTVIVIGPDGVVRHIHVGHGPTLAADLTGEIDALAATSSSPGRTAPQPSSTRP